MNMYTLVWFETAAGQREQSGFHTPLEAAAWAEQNVHPDANGRVIPNVPEGPYDPEHRTEHGATIEQYAGRPYVQGQYWLGNRYAITVGE